MTTLNNEAQSNYARFISATASPASRVGTSVIVGNPFLKRARVFLTSWHTHPAFRTFVEHRWVVLDPGELRRIKVLSEYAGTPPMPGDNTFPKPGEPNRVVVRAYVEDPNELPVHTAVRWDGVEMRIDTGRATQTQVDGDAVGAVTGTVRTLDDQQPADGGRVIVSFERPGSKFPEGHHDVPVVGGAFATQAPADWTTIHATYLPAPGLAESDATRVR
jgi:hypothetical protein